MRASTGCPSTVIVNFETVAPSGTGKRYVPSATQSFGLWKTWSIRVVATCSAMATSTRCDLTTSWSPIGTGPGHGPGSQIGGSTMITPSASAPSGATSTATNASSSDKLTVNARTLRRGSDSMAASIGWWLSEEFDSEKHAQAYKRRNAGWWGLVPWG